MYQLQTVSSQGQLDNSKQTMVPWILAVVFLTATVGSVTFNDRCIDLDGFVGRCVKLSKCETLADIWRSPVRTIKQSERLADSLCGKYRRNPLVNWDLLGSK